MQNPIYKQAMLETLRQMEAADALPGLVIDALRKIEKAGEIAMPTGFLDRMAIGINARRLVSETAGIADSAYFDPEQNGIDAFIKNAKKAALFPALEHCEMTEPSEQEANAVWFCENLRARLYSYFCANAERILDKGGEGDTPWLCERNRAFIAALGFPVAPAVNLILRDGKIPAKYSPNNESAIRGFCMQAAFAVDEWHGEAAKEAEGAFKAEALGDALVAGVRVKYMLDDDAALCLRGAFLEYFTKTLDHAWDGDRDATPPAAASESEKPQEAAAVCPCGSEEVCHYESADAKRNPDGAIVEINKWSSFGYRMEVKDHAECFAKEERERIAAALQNGNYSAAACLTHGSIRSWGWLCENLEALEQRFERGDCRDDLLLDAYKYQGEAIQSALEFCETLKQEINRARQKRRNALARLRRAQKKEAAK